MAIEVKWIKSGNRNIERDLKKLRAITNYDKNVRAYLCIFGRKSNIKNLQFGSVFKEHGEARYADLINTRYGCRIFKYLREKDEP